MVRNAVAVALVAFGLGQDPGCGGVDNPPSGLNAPCTRAKDCNAGLICAGGVCTEPDASVPLPEDGGLDAEVDASDGGG